MKLTLIFTLLVSLSFGKGFSQVKVTVQFEKATIQQVLETLENQTGHVFLYKDAIFDSGEKFSVDFEEEPFEEVLNSVCETAGVDYEVRSNRQIILTEKAEETAMTKTSQQQQTVTGVVTDAGGLSLPGVTVVVKGTSTGTVTNNDGEFSLDLPSGADTLQFSFVGMRTQEVPIDDRTTFTVAMEEESIGIEEVVAIGYGTMRKSDLTGSVARASQELINERPNISVMQSLHGSLPGLNIGQINESGQEPGISIRGRTSLSGASEPLIVVDGVIFRGNLIDLNPNDIESIDILKDASSTAIYGSQATNGVIIITTTRKSNQVGKPMINYSSSYSFEEPANHLGLETPEEMIERMTDADLENSRTEESGYLEPVPDYDVTSRFRTNQQVDAYREGIITDWESLLTNESMHKQSHNLSLSNRNQNSGYFISVGYTDQLGYMVNEEYSRWNARINIDNTITDWLEIGIQSFMTKSDYSGQSVSPNNIYSNTWYAPAYKEDGSLVENPDGLSINPLYVFDADDYDKRLNLFGNIYADIKIPFINGLSFKSNFSNNYRTTSKYYYRPYASDFQGVGSKRESIGADWSNDNILSYKNTLNNIHKVDLTLVYGVEKRNASHTQATSSTFVNDVLGYNRLQAGSADQQTANSGAWEETSLYSMGRLFYGLQDKYLFTGTIRRDGFSGFSEKNKFGVFPSASVAWVASEEKTLKENVSWIDHLKFRLSYGSNGNRTIGRYQTLAKVGGGYNYINGSKQPVYTQAVNDLASPNLKWETTTGLNVGLDFTVINQRISGNIEYYNNNTKNLLYNVDIPAISRFTKFPDNLGKIHNSGIEISLTTINYNQNNFEWTSSLSFSRNRDELRELLGFDLDDDGKEDDLISERLFIGESLNAIYDYEITGELWQLDDDIPSTANFGSYKIKDLNNDGEIEPVNDRKIIGTSDPLFRFSIENKLNYKNWSLLIFINSVQGNNNYYLGPDNLNGLVNYPGLMHFTRTFPPGLDYWMPENPDARYQRLTMSLPNNIQGSHYIPRSFVRLQDVTLSYNFNFAFVDKINIENLRLFFHGKNLATWTKWPGWDPETGQGLVMGGRPVLKSYTFGIDVKF